LKASGGVTKGVIFSVSPRKTVEPSASGHDAEPPGQGTDSTVRLEPAGEFGGVQPS